NLIFLKMKRFIVIAILLFTVSLSAQEVRFGVKGGVNFSKININQSNDLLNSEMKTGFHIGGLVEFKLTNRFALEPQLFYSRQNSILEIKLADLTFPGSTPNDPIFVENINNEYNLDLINLPILAKFYITEGFNIFAGPQFSYLVSEKDKYDIKEFDYGLIGGLGYQFDSGLLLSANYYLGMNDINNFIEPIQNQLKLKQRVIQFSVGYLF
ncbi:porin family protein, partial [Mesonia mobilis]|uniref:porin family protein n=2 Tax=Mesonia mobilis TaxID=369791 RepID=UPI0026F149BA